MQTVLKWQKAAEKTRKANGNRVQLWYDADSGRFMIVELVGQDYVVNQSKGTFQIPLALNYMDYETKAEREADLLRQAEPSEFYPDCLGRFCDSNTPAGFNGDWFSAYAIKAEDTLDDDGYQSVYQVWWPVREDYDPEDDFPEDACEWGSPYCVEETFFEYCQEDGDFGDFGKIVNS